MCPEFDASMLRHTQEESEVEGENWPVAGRNNPMHLALSPHASPFLDLQSFLLQWTRMQGDLR